MGPRICRRCRWRDQVPMKWVRRQTILGEMYKHRPCWFFFLVGGLRLVRIDPSRRGGIKSWHFLECGANSKMATKLEDTRKYSNIHTSAILKFCCWVGGLRLLRIDPSHRGVIDKTWQILGIQENSKMAAKLEKPRKNNNIQKPKNRRNTCWVGGLRLLRINPSRRGGIDETRGKFWEYRKIQKWPPSWKKH